MGNVPATEFKAKCLELMDRVAERRETFVITKRGKPSGQARPCGAQAQGKHLGVDARAGHDHGRYREPDDAGRRGGDP